MRKGQGGSGHNDAVPAAARPPTGRVGRACGGRQGRVSTRSRAGGAAAPRLAARWADRRVKRAERGSVTAEVAVVLPALVVLLGLLLGMAHVGIVQLRIEEAARAGAREVMRGEGSASVEQTVRRLAGSEASAQVVSDSGWTTVEVRARVEGPVVELMNIELVASASGKEEHGG
ncbi:TadE family protein [Arthrobacter cheniae]|uniref:TadE family protein n=1 Tax=Arthrobacter cheniae TaxID=1258888 RepID=A0A3A5MC87_9MICC|nr:TadE family type IV pilus minor pilin [Arthrobacter cheniae]RJT83209.1 TadE family protein [Arthrobacter cheniae]